MREASTPAARKISSAKWNHVVAPELVRWYVPGTYHLTNSGATTWFHFAEEIFRAASVDASLTPIPTSGYPTPARRPQYSVLDNRAWRLMGREPLPSWEEGVRAYLDTLGARGEGG